MPNRNMPTVTDGEAWEWQVQGMCRRTGSELFFHPEGERGAARRARQEMAVALCRQCPVQRECLQHALAVPEAYGVWGGLTEEEREAMELESRPLTSADYQAS